MLIPALRAQATGSTVPRSEAWKFLDRAELIEAGHRLIPPFLVTETEEEVDGASHFALLLREAASEIQEGRCPTEELDQLEAKQQQLLEANVRLIQKREEIERAAAAGGDPLATRALEVAGTIFSDEAINVALAEWRGSKEFEAAVEAGALESPSTGSSSKEDQGRTLEEVMTELQELIGLDSVKAEVQSLINVLTLNSRRVESGMKPAEVTFHLVFTGPPGTGKTTVARLYGELLGSMGMLSKGHLVEVSRQDLVAEYVGQTAVKTDEVLDQSVGGVLFIDEAYSLTSSDSEGDFGREAVETILKRMEDDRSDFAVVVAGYTEEMAEFVDSNPGLESRFTQTIDFPSYDPEELLKIFYLMANGAGYRLTQDAHTKVWSNLYEAWTNRDESFGNARYVRKLLEMVTRRQANRLASDTSSEPAELMTVEASDIPEYADS
jgi:Holliday junction resolvasome RuvABC ATP-dependent DNA helicase subunit